MFKQRCTSIILTILAFGTLTANGQSSEPAEPQGAPVPIYRTTVVARTTDAINYLHHSGATKINFRGTALLPEARGEATVESKRGRLDIDTGFEKLQPATRYGAEYLTYVLWAITPEGRAENLGEILLDGSKGKLHVTTELQAFGLVVTAEPYFAVTQPSDVVVLENFVRSDTRGKIEQINARYELLQRGQYTVNVNPRDLRPMVLDAKTPIELYEARNALQIARWAGAETDAINSFAKAQELLRQAEDYQSRKAGYKPVAMTAREAVQTAEDARLIAVKRQAVEQESETKSQATQAEHARQDAEQAKLKAESDRTLALAQQQAALSEAEKANQAADAAEQKRKQAEEDKAQLREQLRQQFNMILETRNTARGLIVNMSDVLFDTAQATLRPGAREKLAKIAGIILSHPGLNLEVEGHTDSVGGDEYNQRLSERRAEAVRSYLVSQGVDEASITTRGFGKTMPIASNTNPEGRQRNRRVELVVSGDLIGSQVAPGTSGTH